MKRLNFLGLCMIVSCSFFLNAELPRDAGKLELFNSVFNSSPNTQTTDNSSDQDEDEDDFNLEEWKREFLNMRTAVSLYLPFSSFINPYIVGKLLKKEFLDRPPIKMLPFFTNSDAICLPVNAVTFIAGMKYINKDYPLKNLIKTAAVSSAQQIAQTLIFAATDKAATYLPKSLQGTASIAVKAGIIYWSQLKK